MLTNTECTEQFGAMSGCESVLTALRMHEADADVSAALLRVLKHAVAGSGTSGKANSDNASRKFFAKANGVAPVMATLLRYEKNPDIVEPGCHVIQHTASASNEIATEFGSAGAMNLLSRCLQIGAATKNARVCCAASGAVAVLTSCVDTNKRLFHKADGMKALCKVLDKHIANANVCAQACAAMCNAMQGDNDDNTFGHWQRPATPARGANQLKTCREREGIRYVWDKCMTVCGISKASV